MSIALKEASESDYWLQILRATDLITEKEFHYASLKCIEIIKILTTIINTSKASLRA
jgi:four helix bundle protein